MNLVQLRYFVTVARTQNFSRAATELHISQPALTRQIRLLESELATTLMERHSRGITLTDSGKLLMDRAEYQLRAFEQLRSDFADAAFSPSGRLRIGCPPSLNTFIMPRVVKTFMREYPNVIIELQESVSDQLSRDIVDGRLDIAIASATDRSDEQHLSSDSLFEEPVWVFGAKTSRMKSDPRFLDRHPLILTRSNNAARGAVEQQLTKSGIRLNVVVETDSPQLMIEMMSANVGWTIAPVLTFWKQLQKNELSGAPLKGLKVHRRLVRRKDVPANKAIQAFKTLLLPEIDRIRRVIDSTTGSRKAK